MGYLKLQSLFYPLKKPETTFTRNGRSMIKTSAHCSFSTQISLSFNFTSVAIVQGDSLKNHGYILGSLFVEKIPIHQGLMRFSKFFDRNIGLTAIQQRVYIYRKNNIMNIKIFFRDKTIER